MSLALEGGGAHLLLLCYSMRALFVQTSRAHFSLPPHVGGSDIIGDEEKDNLNRDWD